MTSETPPLAVVHHWAAPCGTVRPRNASTSWSEVTCGECRLEQPIDRTGNPEHHVPAAVSAKDRELSAADRKNLISITREALSLAEETIAVWRGRRDRAEALLTRLTSTQSAEKAPGVPEVGSGASGAVERRSGVKSNLEHWAERQVRHSINPRDGS